MAKVEQNQCWALLEGDYIYCVVFDYELAHEIAMEYDFDIEEMIDQSFTEGSVN